MAKKVATKKPAKAAETNGPGLGKKHCPHCSAVIAARSSKCPECGKKIRPKKKVAKKARAVASTNGRPDTDGMEAAVTFITAMGGLAPAQKRLAEIESLKGLL